MRPGARIACLAACLIALGWPAMPLAQEADPATTTAAPAEGEPASAAPQPPAPGPDESAAAEPTVVPAVESTAARKGGASVAMVENAFSPASISIAVGGTVTWTNQGEEDHTTTSSEGLWDSGAISPGGSFSHTFSQGGTFAYICSIHDDMTGTVQVGSTSEGGGSGGSGSGDGTVDEPSGTGPGSESAGIEGPGAAGSADRLPTSGQGEPPLAIVGLALLVLGVVLRRIGFPTSEVTDGR